MIIKGCYIMIKQMGDIMKLINNLGDKPLRS